MAFVSLALPWWVMAMSGSLLSVSISWNVSIYPYQVTTSYSGMMTAVSINLWYGTAALVLVLIGGLLGLVGSLVQRTRMILVIGGLLALLSIIIFAVGLGAELSNKPVVTGYPIVGLFSSGDFGGYFSYTTYLSFGFWLALVAAVLMLVASRKKPQVLPLRQLKNRNCQ